MRNKIICIIKETVKGLLLFIFFLIILISSCNNKPGKNDGKIEREKKSLDNHIGDIFHLQNIVDSSGKKIELDFTKSDITIIDFWFSGCKACVEEMSQFPKILLGKERKISVVSISINSFQLWKTILDKHAGSFFFLADNVPNWKHYNLQSIQDEKLKNEISMDRLKELEEKFNVTFFPAYFIVNKNGIIQSRPENAVNFIENYN